MSCVLYPTTLCPHFIHAVYQNPAFVLPKSYLKVILNECRVKASEWICFFPGLACNKLGRARLNFKQEISDSASPTYSAAFSGTSYQLLYLAVVGLLHVPDLLWLSTTIFICWTADILEYSACIPRMLQVREAQKLQWQTAGDSWLLNGDWVISTTIRFTHASHRCGQWVINKHVCIVPNIRKYSKWTFEAPVWLH